MSPRRRSSRTADPAAAGSPDSSLAAATAPVPDPHAAIVAELRARFGDTPAGPAVAIYLAARGYDSAQVTAVLTRLAGGGPSPAPAGEAVPAAGAAPDPPPRPLRAWAPHERARFTPEAWGRLLRLRADGLGDAEFEHVVDRALLQLDGPVTLAELRALVGDALGSGDAGPSVLH